MRQKAVNIQGISSYLGASSVTDGQCLDVINARNVNGVIKPVNKEKIVAKLLEGTSLQDESKIINIYFHAKAKRYILIFKEDDGLYFFEYDENLSLLGSMSLENNTSVIGVSFIGNIMAISDEEKTTFYLFRDNEYEYLGERPPMPNLNIQVKRFSFISDYDIGFDTNPTEESNRDYIAKGQIDACIKKGNELGFFIDRVFVRYAYRLYDGSYIMHSAPMLIEDDSQEFGYKSSNIETRVTGDAGDRKCNVYVKMFSLNYSMKIDPIIEKWKDIIVAVDVFCSNNIQTKTSVDGIQPRFEKEWNPGDWAETGIVHVTDPNLIDSKVSIYVDNVALRDEILGVSNFYLAASFDIKGEKMEEEIYKNKSKDVFSLNPELTDDNYSHVSYSSMAPYVYNSKLHLAGVIERLFDGYGEDAFCDWGILSEGYEGNVKTEKVSDVSVYTSIKTNQGVMVVKKEFDSLTYPFARMLSYPDNRAFKMQIIFKREGSQTYNSITMPLTAHKYLNISYYLNPTQTRNTTIESTEENRFYGISSDSSISIETLNGDLPTVKNKLERPNVLKVSKVDNPFFFPNESTYTVGEETIIGLSSISEPLSTGQVGQFPLYVFATDGIYSMEVDTTGELTYKNVSSLERHVCNNKESITPAVGGVFFTTDQGVMYLSGSTVKNISDSIKYNKAGTTDPLLTKIYGIESMSCIDSDIDSYLKSGKIRIMYLYKTNEIIISNDAKDYSYKYCPSTSFWYRVNTSYTSFVNVYPEGYAVRDGIIYDIDVEDPEEYNSILIISLPMNLESTNHKKIIQSVLRCDLYVKNRLGVYIMGSLDGQKFDLVSLKEIVSEDDVRHCIDLVTKMKRSKSYKYFSFAITGNLQVKSNINYVGFNIDDSMTNRLR